MCAAAVPYKNGFRNFFLPQRNYKTRWKKEHGCDNYYANHRRPPSPTRKRESWVEFRGWIANSNRNQCFENRLWSWLFIEYFSWFVAVFCSHYCTKQFLMCTNLKQCVKICYTLRKLDKFKKVWHTWHYFCLRIDIEKNWDKIVHQWQNAATIMWHRNALMFQKCFPFSSAHSRQIGRILECN